MATRRTFGYVAQYQEPNANDQDFYAFINWGDRSISMPDHIHGRGNGRYAVPIHQRYVKPGTYTVTVHIRDGIGRKVLTESKVLGYRRGQ
jgi:hypothetical protein